MVYRVMKSDLFDALPELGMGFHFGVDSRTREGFIVLNAEYAISVEEVGGGRAFRQLSEPKADVKDADIVPSQDVQEFLKSFGPRLSNHRAYLNRRTLHESPPFQFQARANDLFVRFSAFRADRRIGPGNSLRPGTYATSATDARLALTGYGNVGRYALPNLLPAVYRFDITVPSGTSGLVGTVSPAFGQAGGGVEVELTGGAPTGSVQGPTKISDY
jgi:hypothetical protein